MTRAVMGALALAGLFLTPGQAAAETRLECGLSDSDGVDFIVSVDLHTHHVDFVPLQLEPLEDQTSSLTSVTDDRIRLRVFGGLDGGRMSALLTVDRYTGAFTIVAGLKQAEGGSESFDGAGTCTVRERLF